MTSLIRETLASRTLHGKRRTVALAYFAHDDGWAVVGSAGGSATEPQWVRNLRADPHAWVCIERRTTPVIATILEGADREPLWATIAARTNVFTEYQASVEREIPIVLLHPR